MSDAADAALQRLALEALGEHGDARARALLERADVAVERGVTAWESSEGRVVGHRVQVRTDARALGEAQAHPAVTDALTAAFAQAIAARRGESLAELVLAWNGAVAVTVTSYRGEVQHRGDASLDEAVAAWLEGAGQPRAARSIRGATMRRSGDGEVMVLSTGVSEGVWVRDALRALLGPRTRLIWRAR